MAFKYGSLSLTDKLPLIRLKGRVIARGVIISRL